MAHPTFYFAARFPTRRRFFAILLLLVSVLFLPESVNSEPPTEPAIDWDDFGIFQSQCSGAPAGWTINAPGNNVDRTWDTDQGSDHKCVLRVRYDGPSQYISIRRDYDYNNHSNLIFEIQVWDDGQRPYGLDFYVCGQSCTNYVLVGVNDSYYGSYYFIRNHQNGTDYPYNTGIPRSYSWHSFRIFVTDGGSYTSVDNVNFSATFTNASMTRAAEVGIEYPTWGKPLSFSYWDDYKAYPTGQQVNTYRFTATNNKGAYSYIETGNPTIRYDPQGSWSYMRVAVQRIIDNNTYFLEIGVLKGAQPESNYVPTVYYTWRYLGQPSWEPPPYAFGPHLQTGVPYNYQLLAVGSQFWEFYFNDLSSPIDTKWLGWDNGDHAFSGGEVSHATQGMGDSDNYSVRYRDPINGSWHYLCGDTYNIYASLYHVLNGVDCSSWRIWGNN